MKVNYQKPVIERILDAIQEAKAQNKVVESIELNASEYQELLSHCYQSMPDPKGKRHWQAQLDSTGFKFMGIPIHNTHKKIRWERSTMFEIDPR